MCEAKLAALPLAEGDEFYFDGNTIVRLSAPPTSYSLSRPRTASLGTVCSHSAATPLQVPRILARRQPCRKLHAVFAATNGAHCAHISFKLMADPKGKFKCQESAQVPVSALFSDDELATYATFVAEAGFEPDQH